MKQKAHGHTLLELLIALALALFLSSILLCIFLQCKKTYDITQRLNNVQTNAHIAFNALSRDIRMAGLIGCVRLVDFSPLNSKITPDTSLIVWHEGYSSVKFPLPILSRAIPHSDIILIQSLDPNTILVKFAKGKHISLLGWPSFASKGELLISDCQHAEVFQWVNISLKYTYQDGSEVGFLNKIIYYIGDTGRQTQKGRSIYALYRRNLNKSLNNPVELVEGIEKMSIRLGVKKGRHLIYIMPDQVKKWSDVRSLEINLLLTDEKLLRRQWKQIIALRERSE
ncbi:MAG: PilW family protein [Rickettsiella sp.]|nr:PilW family protein [Rickettsiella sp.]